MIRRLLTIAIAIVLLVRCFPGLAPWAFDRIAEAGAAKVHGTPPAGAFESPPPGPSLFLRAAQAGGFAERAGIDAASADPRPQASWDDIRSELEGLRGRQP